MKLLRMSFVTAVRALRRNKMRSSLTVLGIVIGVAAVITVIGIGEGATRGIQEQVSTLGTNLLIVIPGSTTSRGARSGWGGASTLTVADARAIERQAQAVEEVTYLRRRATQVVYGSANWATIVQATTAAYPRVADLELAEGDFFSARDERSAARVAVLGATVADELFGPAHDPIGAVIRLRDVAFRVVGVLASKGQSGFGNDRDDIVLVPFVTAERRLIGTALPGLVEQIWVSAASEERMDEAHDEIEAILRERHRLEPHEREDFTIRSQEDLAAFARSATSIMTSVLLGVASVSLLVGGIGIMNIMLVSVKERTREIGIRMAVGAKGKHILLQFLTESILLSALGGAIGTFIGVAATRAVAAFAGWPTVVSGSAIVGAVLFSAAVGTFFGFYPARQASRVDPIESLRYE